MTRHPAEVFGYPIDVHSTQAKRDRKRYWCPFVNQECDKQTRLAPYPMGVCSVRYNNDVIALSPRRFLQDNTVFGDIADHHFHSRSDLLLFREVSIPKAINLGRFDFVMVKHKPMSSEIEDFVTIEFQTGQTTNTGRLVSALQDYMSSKPIEGQHYQFGLNYADIWKRAFTQVLTKGIVMERWGHKIYWVVQEPIYRDLMDRYQLHGMQYDPEHSTIFCVYDLERKGDQYQLYQTRIESSTVDGLFHAFRSNLEVPPKDVFMTKLIDQAQKGLEDSVHLGLQIE